MKIRLLSNGEDWEGLYIDDKLVAEGHKITLDMVMGRIIPRPDFKKVFHEKNFLIVSTTYVC